MIALEEQLKGVTEKEKLAEESGGKSSRGGRVLWSRWGFLGEAGFFEEVGLPSCMCIILACEMFFVWLYALGGWWTGFVCQTSFLAGG